MVDGVDVASKLLAGLESSIGINDHLSVGHCFLAGSSPIIGIVSCLRTVRAAAINFGYICMILYVTERKNGILERVGRWVGPVFWRDSPFPSTTVPCCERDEVRRAVVNVVV
jgi:hypothetical protein